MWRSEVAKKRKKIKHTNTCDIVCPYCGNEHLPDDFEGGDDYYSDVTGPYDSGSGTGNCKECGKKFEFGHSTVFWTEKCDQDEEEEDEFDAILNEGE